MYCFATYIQIQHAYGDFMQQESQIYESIISNILVAGDVDSYKLCLICTHVNYCVCMCVKFCRLY